MSCLLTTWLKKLSTKFINAKLLKSMLEKKSDLMSGKLKIYIMIIPLNCDILLDFFNHLFLRLILNKLEGL